MNKALEAGRELVRILEEQENAQETKCVDNTGKVELAEVLAGEIIKENGNRYKVLEHFDNGTTLIVPMVFMLENVAFDDESRNYKESNLKKLIDEKCLPVFEKDFGEDNLVEHEVDLTSVDMQNEFGTCICKVRLATFDEVRKYNQLLVNEELNDWWWTCTPWSTKERGWEYSIAVVSPSGLIDCNGCVGNNGVRPFCILKSNIFVSKGE